MTFTFLAFEIAFGQQTAKPPIGLARGGIGDDFETIPGDKPRSDEEPDGSLLCFIISPHDAGKAVAVGNADGGKTEEIGGDDQFPGMRGPAQEGEIGGNRKLGISNPALFSPLPRWGPDGERGNMLRHHPNNPCTNQRGAGASSEAFSR